MSASLVASESASRRPVAAAQRIGFLFTDGRRERLLSGSEGPTELFYGYCEMAARGFNARLIEEADVQGAPAGRLTNGLNQISGLFGQVPLGLARALLGRRGRAALDGADRLVATTNGWGMAIAAAKRLGAASQPTLLLSMGLLPPGLKPGQEPRLRALLSRLEVAAIARPEQEQLQAFLGDQPVGYVPFGVDDRFWTPGDPDQEDGGYALAIGNDRHRDWETLIAAWTPTMPPLKIVTRLPVPAHGPNVEVIAGDWKSQRLSDAEIRALYRGARLVVLPIRETMQPSGQSVCLQAMACAKPVVMSDIAGLWNRELMRAGETVMLVPPGDAATLGEAVRAIWDEGDFRAELGRKARALVEERLNCREMAAAIAAMATADG